MPIDPKDGFKVDLITIKNLFKQELSQTLDIETL